MMATARVPKPFLKWAGGKSRLVSVLEESGPSSFKTYHEPFLGSGALFFHLVRQGRLRRAILSDINRELIETYLAVRDNVSDVLALLQEFPYERAFYYRLRERDPWSMSRVERAARMIYLNKTGYNGLYRVNRKGEFNVPFGRYRRPRYADAENLLAVSQGLQIADILCQPFEAVTQRAEAGDWVYFDPPYVPLSATANFTAYHEAGFRGADQRKLVRVCEELGRMGVFVTVSNSDTAFTRRLYSSEAFFLGPVFAGRAINRVASKRGKVRELIITNFWPHSAQLRLLESGDQPRRAMWGDAGDVDLLA